MKEEMERTKREMSEMSHLVAEEKAMMATQLKVLTLEKENLSALLTNEKETNQLNVTQINNLAGQLLGIFLAFLSPLVNIPLSMKKI